MNILKTYFFAEIAKFYRLLLADGTKPIFWTEKFCQGREKRKAFWMYFLFNVIGILALGLLSTLTDVLSKFFLILLLLYTLVILLPTISIAGRRLHDANFRIWWLFLFFIPMAGQIALLILLALPSTPGTNRFGEGK